jgi:hypothetical protein
MFRVNMDKWLQKDTGVYHKEHKDYNNLKALEASSVIPGVQETHKHDC